MAVLKSTTKSKPVEVVKRPNPAGAAIRRGEITISAPIPIVDDRDGEFPIRSHAPAHVLRKEPSQSQLRQSYDDKHRRIPTEPESIQQPAHTVQPKQSLIGQATTTPDDDVRVENRSGAGTDLSPARTQHASLASNGSHSISDKAKRKPNTLKAVLSRLFRRKTKKSYGESSRSSNQSGEWKRNDHHRSVREFTILSLLYNVLTSLARIRVLFALVLVLLLGGPLEFFTKQDPRHYLSTSLYMQILSDLIHHLERPITLGIGRLMSLTSTSTLKEDKIGQEQ